MATSKDGVASYIDEKFGVNAERIFDKYPNFMVFRHIKNQKWFAVFMCVDGEKLRFDPSARKKFRGEVKILNLKCRPDLVQILSDGERILPAYHMNKKHWISLNLSSDLALETICDLIDESFELTKKK